MIWTSDKQKHYHVGYSFGKYGSIVGFLLVSIILAPGKELYDLVCNKIFKQSHYFEINDYKAGVIGAFDGMLFKPRRY